MQEPTEQFTDKRVSRRMFIASGSLFGGLLLVQCTAGVPSRPPAQQLVGPGAPQQSAVPGVYRFLTEAEAGTVEAMVARLIPGDASDPGAVEAGVPTYIDAKLASFATFAEPTYIMGPFVDVVEGAAPDAEDSLVVPRDQLYRYGYQSGITPQEQYRSGLAAIEQYSQSRFDAPFTDLTGEDQDALLSTLDQIQQQSEGQGGEGSQGQSQGQSGGQGQGGEGSQGQSGFDGEEAAAAREAFGDLDPGEFFSTVRTDTIEGMFADPLYGGNQDLVGWTLIGYPGPQRAYSPQEMLIGTRRVPQPLDGLAAMNPDRHAHGVPEALEQPRTGVRDG